MRLLGIFGTILCLATFFAPATGQVDGAAKTAGIAWAASWKDAVAAAKAENKPIMIHFSHDSEAVCLEIARQHFRDARIIELSSKFVCVVGSLSDHGGESVLDDGDPKSCPRYGSCSCAEHRKNEVAARTTVLESNSATAPQFVFTNPDLEILVRRPFMLAEGELIELMERALQYHDPSATPAEVLAKRTKVLEELLAAAQSDNAVKRKQALDVVARRDDPEVVAFLLRQTSGDVDEVKRNEAIRAIAAAQNPNCIGRLTELMRDRSARIRMNTTMALRSLGMAEAAPALIKAFGIESSSRGKALILRAVVTCSHEKDVRKLLQKSLGSAKSLVRAHAVRAHLEMPPDPSTLAKIVGLARGDTDKSVRAVACHAATTIALTAEQDQPENVDKIRSVVKRKLKKALMTVSAKDRDEALRQYAGVCLAALAGSESDYAERIDDFHDDHQLFASGGEID